MGYRFLSVICLLLLLGCSTSYSHKADPAQMTPIEPAALLKFQDIPIPSGFVFIPANSYAFQSIGFRAGLLTYKGKATGEQTLVFFKEQMPLYNWHLVNIVEHSLRMLSFEKEQETCIITIVDKGSRSEITLSVAPKSQGSSPSRRAEKPIK